MEVFGTFNKHYIPMVAPYMDGESAMQLMQTCVLFWNMFRWNQNVYWMQQWECIQPKRVRIGDDYFVNYMSSMRIRRDAQHIVKTSLTCALDDNTASLVNELLIHIILFKDPRPTYYVDIVRKERGVCVTLKGYHNGMYVHFCRQQIMQTCGHKSVDLGMEYIMFIF